MLPSTKNLNKLLTAGLAVAAVAGASAATASADSFAYLKDGDVWLTSTDGARQFQVTGTGAYFAVAQADDGAILATTKAGTLQRLDRYGQIASEITTPVSQPTNGGSTVFVGPLDADVSPDGKTAAYGFIKMGAYKYPDGTMDADMYDGHGFTRSDQATGFLDAGFKYGTDWSAPEFIDNSTVLVSNGPGWPSSPFAIEKVGSGDPRSWFSDPDNMHPMEATISRNKRWVAAVHGPDRLSLSVYRIGDGSLETATINRCFVYSDPAGFRYESPTISGDGKTIAWGSGKSLYLAPLADATAGCPDGQSATEVLPGASSPDWGPADVPASRPAGIPLRTNGGGGGTVTTAGGGGGGTTATPGTIAKAGPTPTKSTTNVGGDAAANLSVHAGAAKLAAALRKGLTVKVVAPRAGRVSIVARNGRTTVGSGAANAKAGKAVAIKVVFNAKARKSLRRAKKATFVLTVKAAGATRTAKVTLKR